MWFISVRFAIGIAIPALLFNLIYRLLPLDMSLIALAYYVALVVLWLLILGGSVGSFLNVVVHRLPQELSLIRP